ncbi:diguanylate cyclase [Crocosphaera sp.]|uniref:diguanylate cyclase domain-containing protein n=1 Tax=Crocosphaera sp. TaxID=2729996 RepID=UPI00262BAC39|nr:diguanylate cyclase [Crocosphaera sp.]MDJ0580781.1 diguanylate cyclase [Crocosphaera sp.]
MNNIFQPIELLENAAAKCKSGHLQITANQVTWDLYFINGMLQDATHSLQSLATIEHYLLRNNQEAVAKIVANVAKNVPSRQPLLPSVLKQLTEKNHLTTDEVLSLKTDLIKDALESYLWLREAEYHWSDEQPQSSHQITIKGDNLFIISNLLDNLIIRMQNWQKFSAAITSPYQRLFCANPNLIQQKVPSGNLNPTALEQLVKFMQGKTLRQISLFVKQDELKVAQLLFPYLQSNILQLQPPQTTLDKLPSIPPLTPKNTPSKTQNSSQPLNNYKPTQSKQQKTYKIVCIDDSPTILNMIKAYLEEAQHEVITIDNPTQSLPYLFKYKPDLILIDFSMPGINGNKLCRIIKTSPLFKNTPLIMISGNEKMLTPENIKEAAATDYLAKPFRKHELQTIVNKYLHSNTNISKPLITTKIDTISSPKTVEKTEMKQLTRRKSDTISSRKYVEQQEFKLSDNLERKPIQITPTERDIDPITRLANRQCVEKYLSVIAKNHENRQSSFSLMFIKVNNLTDIKDTLGNSEGDNILRNIAKQIQSLVRENDVTSRWSNDEFVIIFNNVSHPKILEKISQRILNNIEKLSILSEHKLSLKLSHSVKINSLVGVI